MTSKLLDHLQDAEAHVDDVLGYFDKGNVVVAIIHLNKNEITPFVVWVIDSEKQTKDNIYCGSRSEADAKFVKLLF